LIMKRNNDLNTALHRYVGNLLAGVSFLRCDT
jgi:hypothetical protein